MPTRELVSRDTRTLALGADAVEYVLVRRYGRRGVGLKVDESGLTVSAPSTMPLAKIESIVRESERWILRKIAEWSHRKVAPVAWREGERIPFLGGGLTLRLARGARSRADRRDAELWVVTRDGTASQIEQAVVRWYKRAAHAYLAERLRALADAAKLSQPTLTISSAMARWGSCSSKREVRLAWRLVKAPADLVDYVICHELAHLRHMDHSGAFWAEVGRQCPDYRARRERLNEMDHLYRTF
ncbi:MAG TPA: SprT family zinc-dependent metalloprotease [Usitatibacter sp.]|nr:SprT family zinc-dependent metalloprotease [Usitatibacter sp.]